MKLSTATEILKRAGIDDARREARLLFQSFTDIPDSLLYGGDAESDSIALLDAIDKRAKRVPLQYILGEVDFYRETYKVTPDTLIPRSDTEILVDEVIKRLPSKAHFIDLCTGSGCIALSVLNNSDGTTAVAADISEEALLVASLNAKRLSLSERIEFCLKDALAEAIDGEFFAVVSNPPYVTEAAYKNLSPEIYFEPSIAFLGGADGLDFYKRIVPLYKEKIARDGFFAFEIGFDQGDSLRLIAEENSLSSEIIKDYSGNDRVAVLRRK